MMMVMLMLTRVQMPPEERRPVTEDGEATSTHDPPAGKVHEEDELDFEELDIHWYLDHDVHEEEVQHSPLCVRPSVRPSVQYLVARFY